MRRTRCLHDCVVEGCTELVPDVSASCIGVALLVVVVVGAMPVGAIVGVIVYACVWVIALDLMGLGRLCVEWMMHVGGPPRCHERASGRKVRAVEKICVAQVWGRQCQTVVLMDVGRAYVTRVES